MTAAGGEGLDWRFAQSCTDKKARFEGQRHVDGCHTLDDIPMNSPFLDRGKWEAAVEKMMGPLGAPLRAQHRGHSVTRRTAGSRLRTVNVTLTVLRYRDLDNS